MALINTEWLAVGELRALESEDEIMVLAPYPKVITLMRKHGGFLVRASHDGTDEAGDIETLKMLCLYRFSGGQNV